MSKTFTGKLYLVSAAALMIVFMAFTIQIAAGQEDIFSEVKGKMEGVSDKEKVTLQKLFIQVQEIEAIEREEKEAAREIEKIRDEIKGLQRLIADEETLYAKKQESLKKVLQTYQRMGPGNYLEIILESDSLRDFLRRMNVLRDLTRNTGRLLEEIKKSKEKQSAEKTRLAEKLGLVEKKQESLLQTLAKKKQVTKALENDLEALAEEKEHYQEYLKGVQQTWGELKPFFIKNIKELSKLIEQGDFSPDAFQYKFSFTGIKVSIDEKSLNEMITKDFRLPEIVFNFHPGKVIMKVPEKSLVLEGKFVIADKHSLKFEVEEGSFYGLPLKSSSLVELFQEGYLVLNLKSQLGEYSLKSMEMTDKYLSFSIKPE